MAEIQATIEKSIKNNSNENIGYYESLSSLKSTNDNMPDPY